MPWHGMAVVVAAPAARAPCPSPVSLPRAPVCLRVDWANPEHSIYVMSIHLFSRGPRSVAAILTVGPGSSRLLPPPCQWPRHDGIDTAPALVLGAFFFRLSRPSPLLALILIALPCPPWRSLIQLDPACLTTSLDQP
ncbi:hypothetical protein BS50DRAFT_220627 [Corynespora cassiicola Philippines]|uniref:Uncharacterized protein n=1 Tax=Corynespora cassiicola Philippines TaxID=1448308 RepID=A0A2T2N349_CORCC|nr:hypothetical protein BS50DRAFT_220627 [Corynespora cassiicola Philippines]